MRFYKLNGVWQSWDYLHNELGYAEHETRPTVFKSCADATWGEDAGNGYYDGDVSDMINGTFWTDADPTGWFDLDGLVWNSETYPADAAPSLLVKDGVASDALVITCDDGNYYLIRAIIDTTAWIPESEVEALGWRSPSFVVVDSTTGKVVSGCNQALDVYELPSVVLNSEDGYETYELPSISLAVPKMVIGVPISGPVQAFWFTDEGRAETSDKTFTVVGNPLFDEDGSVARNELYDSAIPLSFMQHDGNMFEADSDSDIVRYLPVTDRLVLSIPGDSTTRDKSAWSVQCAKLFVLSYVNEQLPDVQIELPINEVGTYGTSITLPTIDGEYESGGKTWKPSAWNIGAFGDSYTLKADTVAHLIFEEVQQYQEITLYGNVSPRIACQINVTSEFTGDVNTANVLQLYTDENKTIPFVFDYSNDYEFGYYNSDTGEWIPAPTYGTVADMPSSTVDAAFGTVTCKYVLLDTGCLWFICNNSNDTYIYDNRHAGFYGTSVVRIYPKGQQHYAAYCNYNNLYGNYSLGSSRPVYPWPVGTSGNYKGWRDGYPEVSFVKFLGSAGNELSNVGTISIARNSSNALTVTRTGYSGSINVRCVIFTLDTPTFYAWLRTDKTNETVASGSVNVLYDESGNAIPYDSNSSYKAIGVSISSGANCFNERIVLIYSAMINSEGHLAFELSQAQVSVSAAKIWYIKTPIS